MKGENMPLTTGCKGNGLVKRHTKGHINNSRVLEAHLTWEAWETWMPAETITERFAVCYREVALLFQLLVWNTWICWFHYKPWRQAAGDTRRSFQFAGSLCSVHCSLHTKQGIFVPSSLHLTKYVHSKSLQCHQRRTHANPGFLLSHPLQSVKHVSADTTNCYLLA